MPDPEQSHTPEPWVIKRWQRTLMIIGNFDGTHGQGLAHTVGLRGIDGLDAANARRIIACVNACRGIPTEDLEDLDDGDLLTAWNIAYGKGD